MIIRAATIDEAEAIATLLMDEMWPDINYGEVDFEKGLEEVEGIIRHGSAWLVMDGDEIAATAGICIGDPFWWSSEQFITDKWIFVREKWRKSRAAVLIFKQFAMVADQAPVPVLLSIASMVDREAKERLFARYGDRVGNFYRVRPARMN